MLRIKAGIYPSTTGWTFPDTSGGTIRGKDLEDLVASVAEFRARNKLPEGDPFGEVTEWLCQNNGSLCRTVRVRAAVSAGTPAPPPGPGKFGDRVLEWAARFLEGPRVVSKPNVIRARAEACRKCPFNEEYASSCASCKRTIRRAIEAFVGGFPRDAMRGLGGCRHFFWENRLACGSDIVIDSSAPDGCWRKNYER